MRGEYPVLIVFAAMGMGMMASARDMMTLYIGLELNSLAAYVLASFMRTDDRSAEAGLKYFVSARSRAGCCSMAFRCSTGSAARPALTVSLPPSRAKPTWG